MGSWGDKNDAQRVSTPRPASRTPTRSRYSARLSPPRNRKGRRIEEPGSAAPSFLGIQARVAPRLGSSAEPGLELGHSAMQLPRHPAPAALGNDEVHRGHELGFVQVTVARRVERLPHRKIAIANMLKEPPCRACVVSLR